MFKKLSDIFNNSEYKRHGFRKTAPGTTPDIIDFHQLVNDWENIVGPKLAKNTVPLKNQNKVLTILTNHPAYAQQLSFMEDMLKEKIFQTHPTFKSYIKKIIFKTSTEYFDNQKDQLEKTAQYHSTAKERKPDYSGKLHPQNPEYNKLYHQFAKEYEFIEDGETKERLISIAVQRELLK